MEIPTLPALADKGAYHHGQRFSPADLQAIQQYGTDRGVEVILEFDMPGHTASIALSFPELIAAFNIQPGWSNYGAEPPTGQLKLNDPAVYEFLAKLWSDVLPRVSPYSAYFHTGGDGLNVNAYRLDPTVKSNSTAIIQPLLQKFVDFNLQKIRAAGLTPIVWEEMLLQWNLTLGSDVVEQSWQSDLAVAETVAKGHKALAGNSNLRYLDCGKGQWLDFQPASAPRYYPFADYCSPTKNWCLIYSYDPLTGVPANATHLVLGAKSTSGASRPMRSTSTTWCGRARARRRRCCGAAPRRRTAGTGACSTPARGWGRCGSGYWIVASTCRRHS